MTDPQREKLEATLGKAYTLERELGGGGMSRVFVACENALGRTVVIKVLSPDLAEALNIERFRREIQLAARLQHPHIVPLLTAGESAGLPYFTMPFIQGESLRDRLKARGELPVSDAVRVLREVAAALAYAHANGVVHRDIKPDNVMISGGSAMVMDFGVAKAVSDAAAPSRGSTLTQLGVALGTPAYMAPEQAAADPATDHRADIYAFGAMAYELLTGETPFAGRPAQAMLAAHAVETPEQITRRRPAVPEALASLIMRCLEKRPSDRPQTADEIVRALDSLPTSTGGIRATVASPGRRSRGWLVGAALGALVVVGGALLVTHQQQRREAAAAAADAPTMIAVLPFENQGPAADQYFADGLTDAITNRLSNLHGLGVIDSRSAAQYKGSAKSAKQIGRELGVQYLLQGTVQWATDEHGKRQVQISPSLIEVSNLTQKPAGGPYLVSPADVFRVQTEVATKVADALNVVLNGQEEKMLSNRPTTNARAYDAYLRGQAFDDQNEGWLQPDLIRNALEAYTEATQLDPKFALAFARLGAEQIRWAVLDLTDTTRLSAARRSIDSSLVLEPDLPEGHVAHAHFLWFFMRDREGSFDELKRANALRPNDATLLTDLGHAQVMHGQTAEGFANIAKAVRLAPRSLDAIQWAARENYNSRRYAEAERYADQYINLAPTSPIGYNWKINAEVDGRGDTAAARRTLETAAARGVRWSIELAAQYTNIGPAGYARLLSMSLADLGASQFIDSSMYYSIKRDVYVAENQPAIARAYSDSILKIGLSPRYTGPLQSWRYTILASAYATLGRRTEAFGQIAAAERYIGTLSSDDPQRANIESQIAHVFGTMGEADSAIAHIKLLLTLPSGFSKETAKTDISFVPLKAKPAWQQFLAEQH